MAAFEAALGGTAKIGTVIGRYYAMDRDKRWERVQRAYDLIADGKGANFPPPTPPSDAGYAAEDHR